jgi:hypothetical protein
MNMSSYFFDLLGWLLLPCALWGQRGWLTGPWQERSGGVTAVGGLLLLLQIPFGSASLVNLLAMLRGLFGGLSVTTVIFLLVLVLQNGREISLFARQEARWLPPLIAIVALLFYPAALGLGALDPYEWGHDEALVLPLTVGALALLAWLGRWRVSALALVLALAFWRLRVLESTNLWDYLLDPLLTLAVLGLLVARGLRWMWRKRSARSAVSAA